jgi:hypothetical protein
LYFQLDRFLVIFLVLLAIPVLWGHLDLNIWLSVKHTSHLAAKITVQQQPAALLDALRVTKLFDWELAERQ